MIKKKLIVFLLSLFLVLSASAQISVESCTLVENDLDARNYPVLDDEGSACALVKIITTAKGFNYEIGQLPVKKVDENHVGEIWVYVPDGAMKMKIAHPDLGSLRGADVENGYYMFPQRLKKGKVYRLVLTHKEVVKTIGPQDPGNLTFHCNLDGAEVLLGENERSMGQITNNQLSITWPKGQPVKYRVHKDRYEDVIGTVTVEENTTVPITLKPLFGTVNITSMQEATIYINDTSYGVGQASAELMPGTYTIKATKPGYHDAVKSIALQRGQTIPITIEPDLILGSVKVTTTPSNATIYIDDKDMGTTPTTISQLTVGSHRLELRESQYVPIKRTINIIGDKTIEIEEILTTKKSIQTLRDHKKKNHFYLTGGFMAGNINALTAGIGYYMPKALGLEVEIGGCYSIAPSNPVYCYRETYHTFYLTGSAKYSPYAVYASLGSSICCGLKFYITPKVGLRHIRLSANWDTKYFEVKKINGSYALCGTGGIKFSYIPCPHLVVYVQPEYSYSVKESNGYTELKKYASTLRSWEDIFNVTIGFNIYF